MRYSRNAWQKGKGESQDKIYDSSSSKTARMKTFIAALIVLATPQIASAQYYPEFDTQRQYSQNLQRNQQRMQNFYQQQQIQNNTNRINRMQYQNNYSC